MTQDQTTGRAAEQERIGESCGRGGVPRLPPHDEPADAQCGTAGRRSGKSLLTRRAVGPTSGVSRGQ
jgi:hypothetical protein